MELFTQRVQTFSMSNPASYPTHTGRFRVARVWSWPFNCSGRVTVKPALLAGLDKVLLSWIKRDQLDVTCFIISPFNAQHVSDVNTSILRGLRLICWVISWAVLLWFDMCCCYIVVWLWWCGIRMQAEARRKLLKMDVLISETCWALNNEIIKQVTSSWSLFIHLSRWCTIQ